MEKIKITRKFETIEIDRAHKEMVENHPEIMGVLFVGGKPEFIVSRDVRNAHTYQILLTRQDILGENEIFIKQ